MDVTTTSNSEAAVSEVADAPELRAFEQREEAAEHRKFTYVPGLDGLRGLGVILMMLYHGQVSWLGLGPLFTIEMFFVLSGFLITSLFIIERENTKTIDLRRFWNRRFRRLLPALVLMFAAVVLWSFLPPERGGPSETLLAHFRGDGVAAMTYTSNWYFIFSGSSYFQAFEAPSPLKHTWSLSIEEQFYLMVAVAMFAGFKAWGTRKKRWIFITFGLAALSAIWMAVLAHLGNIVASGQWLQVGPFGPFDPGAMSQHLRDFLNLKPDANVDPSRMYYGTDSRLQASLVGVGMAFVVERINWSQVRQWVIELCGAVGIGGLLIMFFFIPHEADWIYYGGFFLADLLTGLAIIALMAPKSPVAAMPFTAKPLVFLGALSYSLYVWHFPIFTILDGQRFLDVDGWPLNVWRFAISFVVAYLSYRFYENPIRYQGLNTTFRKVGAVVLIAGSIGLLFVSTARAKPDTGGFGSIGESDVDASGGASECIPPTRPQEEGKPTCTSLLFAGDSMAHTMLLAIEGSAVDREDGYVIYPATVLGCGILEGDRIVNGKINLQKDGCLKWPELWQNQVDKVNPELSVVLVWGWDVYDRRLQGEDGEYYEVPVGSQEWADLMSRTIEQGIDILSSRGGKVALLTMPCIDLDADTPNHPDPEAAEPHRIEAINDVIREVAARNKDTTVVYDLAKFLCPDGKHYRAKIDGIDMSPDGIHFTKDSGPVLWDWLVPQIRQTLGQR
ncbi:MAG: acyltransferase [Acidimicrobiales bacterium]|nr:acyltransferase [Acidimicrobiales bacterium]